MALIHHEKKEINAKIVYYGPGISGKTTNIKFIYEKMKPEYRGKLKFMNTKSGKMLFFDFMRPDQIGIKGYDIRFHIYTVPGEITEYAIWKTVLKGADGLVFVADSEPYRMPDNLQSFEKLTEYLETQGKGIKDIPCLFQCNKQDVPGATTLKEMKDLLHSIDCPMIPASAQSGDGVLNTLSTMVKMVLQTLRETSLDVEDEEKHTAETEEPALTEQCEEIGETSAETILSAEPEMMSEPSLAATTHPEFISDSTEAPPGNEVTALTAQCEETAETTMEGNRFPVDEEVICEPPPEFISFTGFASAEAPRFAEDEEPRPSTETSESAEITAKVDFAGELEQVAPGHLRLPIIVTYGQEIKRLSINLRLSIETPEN